MHPFFDNLNTAFLINTMFFLLAIIGVLLAVKFSLDEWFDLIQFSYKKLPLQLETTDKTGTEYQVEITFQNLGKRVLYKSEVLNNIVIKCNSSFLRIIDINFTSTCKFSSLYGKLMPGEIDFFLISGNQIKLLS